MERGEEVKKLEEEIMEVEEGTDWAWWLLIVTSVIAMIVALYKML